ncbi:MAG: DUF1816 domain-containing protein [Microcoleaceae cyanobacterium]
MKEILISILNFFGLAIWVKIDTENPICTYYFGPFLTKKEAIAEQQGYREDIESEDATIAQVKIKRCKPLNLTVLEPGQTLITQRIISHFSAQP